MSATKARFSLAVGVLVLGACGQAQPPDERDYDVYHYGSFEQVSPAHFVRMDNNHEILTACQRPSTKDSLLQRGIDVTDSQIELLVLMGLLDRQAESLVARVPILDRETTARLRDLTDRAASAVADATRDSVADFKNEVESRGGVGGAYHLLVAYILDGKVWERFGEMGLRRYETETPQWSGELWAVSPSRGVAPGTITFWYGKAVMYVMWTEAAAPMLRPFMAGDRQLRQLFAACVDEGRVEDGGLVELFAPYGMVDENGACEFPIFTEQPEDPLFEAADTLAREVAEQAASHLDLEAMVEQFPFRDESQALVVAYHELMWALTDHLERTGALERPSLLKTPANATQQEVGDLVFAVKKPD